MPVPCCALRIILFVSAVTNAEVLETHLFKGSFLLASSVVDISGNEFLSADIGAINSVGCASHDAGTGRQRWKLIYGGADWYNIVTLYGSSTSYDFLGFTDPAQSVAAVQMYHADDGSVHQRWQLIRSSTGGSTYYIKPFSNQSDWWLTHEGNSSGVEGVTLSRSTDSPSSEWMPLEYAGQYDVVNGAQYLSVVGSAPRSVAMTGSDDGSGHQQWQLVKRFDGVYYLLSTSTKSQLKYLAVAPGGHGSISLDTRQSNSTVLWVLAEPAPGVWTIQSFAGGWLGVPTAIGSTQFIHAAYTKDGSLDWSLVATDSTPTGNRCIADIGNNDYVQGPMGFSWNLVQGPAASWYYLETTDSQYSTLFLSSSADGSGVVLLHQDDGTGMQRWEINKVSGNGYYIQPWAPISVGVRYLSGQPGTAGMNLSFEASPGTSFQEFAIGHCPTTETSGSDGTWVILAVVVGLLGVGVLAAGLGYMHFQKQKHELQEEQPWDRPAGGKTSVEPAHVVGKGIDEFDDVHIDINELQTASKASTGPRSRCWYFSKVLPCHIFAAAAT